MCILNEFTSSPFPSPHSTHQHIAFRLWTKLQRPNHPSQFGTAFFSHFQWYLISIQIVANSERDSFLQYFLLRLLLGACFWVRMLMNVYHIDRSMWSLLTVKLASLIGMVHFDWLIRVLAPIQFCYLNGVTYACTQHGYLNFTSFQILWHMRSDLFRAQMHCILPFTEMRRETDSSAFRISSVCAAPLMYKVPRRQSCRKWCCFPRKMLVRSWLELRRWLSNLPCAFRIVFSSFQVLCDFLNTYDWVGCRSAQHTQFMKSFGLCVK